MYYFFYYFLLLLTTINLIGSGLAAKPQEHLAFTGIGLSFLENKGQIVDQYKNSRSDIDFKLNADGVNVFIGSGQIQYQWIKPQSEPGTKLVRRSLNDSLSFYRMDVLLLDANPNASIVKEDKINYFETYYFHHCAQGLRAHSYRKVTYKNIYPNIDWVLYIDGNQLKYEFVVYPGGNVDDIKLKYQGANALQLEKDGSLTAIIPYGKLTEMAPYSYTMEGGEVSSAFVLNDSVLGYDVDTYKGVLVIDPALVWSTYYGGNGVVDAFEASQCDRFGNIYLTGTVTSGLNIATTGSHQIDLRGGQDAFLVKFDRMGSVCWGTYYGGEQSESAGNVACDTFGNVYIAGETRSSTFIATPGSYQPTFLGGGDAYVVKFDSSGIRQWATYFGGEGEESTSRISVYGDRLYLVGSTESSTHISTIGAHQETIFNHSSPDGYIASFDLSGNRIWSTYFGGEKHDELVSVCNDGFGNIYVSGLTYSDSNIASLSSFQTNRGGESDAFIAKFTANGQKKWSTYVGGEATEEVTGFENIICDNSGNVYIIGNTRSDSGISNALSYQGSYQGNTDGYLMGFDSTGEQKWSTYIGGTNQDALNSIKYSSESNSLFLGGNTNSLMNVTTANAYQTLFAGTGIFGAGDALLMEFDLEGAMRYGTYFGFAGDDAGLTVSVGESGDIFLGGLTNSALMGTPGSYLQNYPGTAFFCGYVAKFCFALLPPHMDVIGADTVCNSGSYVYSIDPDEGAEGYIWTLPAGWMGSSDSNSIEVLPNGVGGQISVQVVKCDDTSNRIVKNISLFPSNPATIRIDGYVLRTQQPYARYQWCLNGLPISGAINSTYTVLENGDYSVITETEMGCVDTSDMYTVTNAPNAIDESRSISDTYVYPNPASDKLHVNCPVDFEAVLLNVEGKVLYNIINSNLMDIKSLAPGVYFLNIRDRERRPIKTEKIIKR